MQQFCKLAAQQNARHVGGTLEMPLTPFSWPLWLQRAAQILASTRPQVLTAGGGAGLGTPAPWGLLAGGLGWPPGLRRATSPSPPCARQPGPLLPPPPGLPLRPLHRLVRALTCEIKRDFNYLSAKQQLERITAQQQSPPPLPPPGLSPPFLQPPPRL